jgi:membrane associated rhomboid family serine protease
MIPLRDNVPGQSTPWVTWMLILINILVFRYQTSLTTPELNILIAEMGFIPMDLSLMLSEGFQINNLIPAAAMVTSLFLHGSWMHLIVNMWSLWLFGDNIEDTVGHFRFLLFYLAGGICASLTHFIFNPGSLIPTIGASGAIAAIMGAYVILFPMSRILTLVPLFFIPFFFRLPAVIFIGFWFATQVFSGVFALFAPMTGGIAWWAHIGGFIYGVFLIPLIRKKRWEYRCFYEDGHYHCQYD